MTTAPPARIGKTTGVRPRPANSEKLARNAAVHVASEMAAGDMAAPPRKVLKRKRKLLGGLINRVNA